MQAGAPLEHAALQALLIFDAKEADEAALRDRAQACGSLFAKITATAVSASKHDNIVKLEAILDHLSRPTAVDRHLVLSRVQRVKCRVSRGYRDVAIQQRAGNLLALTIVDFYRSLWALSERRNWHQQGCVLNSSCIEDHDLHLFAERIGRSQCNLEVVTADELSLLCYFIWGSHIVANVFSCSLHWGSLHCL